MSASTAIGMVSESLRNLLLGEGLLKLAPDMGVTILAPDEAGDLPRVNLFLYKVQENSILKNMDWQVRPGEPDTLVPPPLSLNLFYLMTPYAATDMETGNITAHEILGEAMRIFYENPIIPEIHLAPGLINSREQIKIMLNTLDLDELSWVWNTSSQPFRLSVLYEVSVVQLDMLSESEREMATRVRPGQIRVLDVRAPFNPPVVESIDPPSGPAGTIITFSGENLSGWRAYVRIMRQSLAPQDLTADTFPVVLPGDVLTGFHEIRVDISHLFRRTFLFEVTPAVDNMVPLNGPVGTIVTFHGRDLSGQQAFVTIMETPVLDGEALIDDEFTVTIPADLPPGPHEIHIDISHLYRKTFIFEVTA